MSADGGTKAVLAALAANSGIAVAKFGGFVLTGSSSMLSEAIHSVADSLNQVLLLVGSRRAAREASDHHQFGYGRVRYLYGFVVAIVLFIVGGAYSIYEGWHKLHDPHPLENASVAVGILVVAVILESLSFRTALIEANRARGHRSLARFIRDAREPELPVILLEDFGALIGLVLALLGVAAAVVTGDGRWDGLGAISIGALLVVIAVVLVREMASLLVGEAALPEEEEQVRAAIESGPLVKRIIHLRTMHLGPHELLVAVKIGVAPELTAVQIAEGIDDVEARLRSAVPSAVYVFVEPDIDRG